MPDKLECPAFLLYKLNWLTGTHFEKAAASFDGNVTILTDYTGVKGKDKRQAGTDFLS